MVNSVMDHFGISTVDFANAEHRERFQKILRSSLERAIRWQLQDPMEKAVGKAVAHVIALMGNSNYQELRRLRQKASLERRKERDIERARERKVEMEERRQQSSGIVN